MTRTARRLAELDQISRCRSLTDAEQIETVILAKRERRNDRRRSRYQADPAYRATRINRDWKRNLRDREARA